MRPVFANERTFVCRSSASCSNSRRAAIPVTTPCSNKPEVIWNENYKISVAEVRLQTSAHRELFSPRLNLKSFCNFAQSALFLAAGRTSAKADV